MGDILPVVLCVAFLASILFAIAKMIVSKKPDGKMEFLDRLMAGGEGDPATRESKNPQRPKA
jgi:hypothetical protein